MSTGRLSTISWIGRHVLPYEKEVRAWLRRALRVPGDTDDVLQEAYCRMSALQDVAHIDNPRAYFFRVVRNVLLEQIRRARVVRIDTIAQVDSLDVLDEAASPERVVAGQSELARVERIIASLPSRCRWVIELRKIHGLSQREAAEALGVREAVIEREVARGIRLILKGMLEDGATEAKAAGARGHERTRDSEKG
ncbi:RNA polymerase sigma factor [Steroidobacter sp.]|uniref:RNA polymerase sigma factor n=1 Tax=Steroidobacter sp. TaxID=1978227 RepID=UPI001A603242|nr:RNA polymerase sigma factor [Steroidobacter sp.]MBL8265977.1 RNA polymerase sigma factor [Steroidobacter sp.]